MELATSPATKTLPTAGRRTRRGWQRAYLAFADHLATQLCAAVVLAHVAALPLLFYGKVGGWGYAVLALGFSCAALVMVGRRWSRALNSLHMTLLQFSPPREGEPTPIAPTAGGLRRLQHGLDN